MFISSLAPAPLDWRAVQPSTPPLVSKGEYQCEMGWAGDKTPTLHPASPRRDPGRRRGGLERAHGATNPTRWRPLSHRLRRYGHRAVELEMRLICVRSSTESAAPRSAEATTRLSSCPSH